MLAANDAERPLPFLVQRQMLRIVFASCAVVFAGRVEARPSDGAAITPAIAEALYARMAPLREPDGCRLSRFDTSRFQITVGLDTPSGAQSTFSIAAAPQDDAAAQALGGWSLAVPAELEHECSATIVAVRRVLSGTAAPRGEPGAGAGSALTATIPGLAPINRVLLSISFVLLVVGTAYVLARQWRAHRPPAHALIALLLVTVAALALRLGMSPRTFLHEYYHIAETLADDLSGDSKGVYGDTGPALFQLVAALLRRPSDVQVIFVTNAVIASLAIPAMALLDLAVVGSWARAILAAVLLCVLPQHLRFSASEVVFVQSITFGLAAVALFALYVQTRRLADALCAALALSLAVQTRPEMLFFPIVPLVLVLLVEPRSWRVVLERRTLIALFVVGVLLVPRLLELLEVLGRHESPSGALPEMRRYWNSNVFFQSDVTPPVYWLVMLAALPFALRRKPGFAVWAIAIFLGYLAFSLSLYDNRPYDVRTQLLPIVFLLFVAAGAASAWMAPWRDRWRLGAGVGALLLAGLAVVVVVRYHGFVTALRDQQLEWAFLERTVPLLPQRATLLAASEIGGRDLDAFPQFLLRRDGKDYRMVDVRRAARGEIAWPAPEEDLLYYQGMFCYFAFPDAPPPEPMTSFCRDVTERYVTEPLFVEELHTQGYSELRYAPPPYRIGFFRLKAAR